MHDLLSIYQIFHSKKFTDHLQLTTLFNGLAIISNPQLHFCQPQQE